MIGTWSVGAEKGVAAYDHYNQFKGMEVGNGYYVGNNGEIVDSYGNFVLDLPIDKVLNTIEEIRNYYTSEDDRYEYCED